MHRLLLRVGESIGIRPAPQAENGEGHQAGQFEGIQELRLFKRIGDGFTECVSEADLSSGRPDRKFWMPCGPC